MTPDRRQDDAPEADEPPRSVLVVLAGAADPPGPETPLASAETMAMDRVAREGRVGIALCDARTPWDGFTHLLSLRAGAPSLGVAEALSAGVRVPAGTTVYRADFVTLDEDGVRDPFAGSVGGPEAGALFDALAAGLEGVRLTRLEGAHNLALVDEPPGFCPSPVEAVDHWAGALLPESGIARAAFERARAILSAHDVNSVRVDLGENPANGLWLHGGGVPPDPVDAGAWLRGAVLVGNGGALRGLGLHAGVPVVQPGGGLDELAAAALEALRSSRRVVVRTRAVLAAAALGDAEAKRDALSRVDARLVAPLLGALEELGPFRLAVATDSVLDTRSRRLVPGALPFALLDSAADRTPADRGFDETACCAGFSAEGGLAALLD